MATTTKQGVQNLRGTAAQWTSKQTVLKAGELGFCTDADRLKIGNGSKKFDERPHLLDSYHEAAIGMLNNSYRGTNLVTKFAEEIADYGGDAFNWIHNERIKRNKMADLYPWDYIDYQQTARTISDGTTSYALPAKTMRAYIAGIDTYYNYGYPSGCPHHIDFLTVKDTIGVNIPWQTCDNNNGSTKSPYPWLASKLYACLNGVNNVGIGFDGKQMGFDASTGGVLQSMPQYLQNNIAEKRIFSDSRYSGSGALTESTAGDIHDVGKIWIPTEVEVYGFPCNTQQRDGLGINRSAYGSIQYPIFANNNAKQTMGRVHVWLQSVASGSSSRACYVDSNGIADTVECANAWVSAWVGFRLSA